MKIVEKRKSIYNICSVMWKKFVNQEKNGSQLPKNLWNEIDNMVFEKLLEEIEKNKKIGGIYTIKYIKQVLECVSKYYNPFYTEYSIVPNKNGNFN